MTSSDQAASFSHIFVSKLLARSSVFSNRRQGHRDKIDLVYRIMYPETGNYFSNVPNSSYLVYMETHNWSTSSMLKQGVGVVLVIHS